MTLPPDINTQLQKASAAIQNDRRGEAAGLLKSLLRQNPRDFRVWLLLAEIAPSEKKEQCLQKADACAPGHPLIAKSRTILLAPLLTPLVDPQNKNGAAAENQSIPADIAKTQAVKTVQATPAATPAPQPKITPDLPSPSKNPSPQTNRPRVWLATAGFALFALLLLGTWWIYRPLPLAETTGAPAAEIEADIVVQQFSASDDNLQLIAETAASEPTSSATPQPTATAAPTTTPTPDPLLPKNIAASQVALAEWTPTPLPTNTPEPTPTVVPTAVVENYVNISWPAVGSDEQWVDVDLTSQTLTAYVGTTPVLQTAISSGLAPNYTVTGQFRIYYRLESQTMDGRRLGFDYVTPNVPHVQYFYGDFALHGAYWHNNFGQPMSHGCVNLSLGDAEWLYNWAGYGTLVNVHY